MLEFVVDGEIVVMVVDGGVIVGVVQEVVWIVEWNVIEQVFDCEVDVLVCVGMLGYVQVGGLL